MSTPPGTKTRQSGNASGPATPLPPSARQASDGSLVQLFDAYRLADGIADGEGLLRRIATARRHSPERGSDLPDARASVNFSLRGVQWWPLFQFDADMAVRPEVARVARELTSVMADWEVALWFLTPNTWLGDQPPIACVWTQADAALQAARADRFIAVG
ncbi:MAG: hypothetical protein KIT60_13805 [Burkholderiaceae bacterium]|nr:hypothetical protein [Burkholderiaceae bacterium]